MPTIEKEKYIRARIKYWLEVHEMSRKELSEKLQVTESALNGWLATRAIPPARWKEIKAIFEPHEEPERKRIVGTSLSDEEFAQLEKAAAKLGMTVEDTFRECILRQIKDDLGEQ